MEGRCDKCKEWAKPIKIYPKKEKIGIDFLCNDCLEKNCFSKI